MVIIYRNEYIRGDPNIVRFKFIVLWFVFRILLLVVRPNLVSIILGWDGLGLSSYCLVIYYSNSRSNSAGIITVLTNRLGDVILLRIIGIIRIYGQFDYIMLFQDKFLRFLAILVAITKSAQIPFRAWLPAAIAAPTPVSSLVHSSTLVTAGVYFLFRFGEKVSLYRDLLLFLGSLTMIISGICGCYELDFKKVIALSTLSQLGMIFFGLGLGIFNWVFLHLLVHALFKSIIFIGAGVIIHSIKRRQDFRCIGGLLINFPFVGSLFLLRVLRLCGFPFLGGFYSKDLLVEVFFSGGVGLFSVLIFIVGLLLTLIYRLRFSFSLIRGGFSGFRLSNFSYGRRFFYSLFVLFFFSLFRGFTLLGTVVKLQLVSYPSFEEKFLAFLLFIFIFYIYRFSDGVKLRVPLRNFFSSIIGLSKISSFVSLGLLNFSLKVFSLVDIGWMEKTGPLFVGRGFSKVSNKLFFFSVGSLRSYFIVYFFWFLIVVVMFY